MAVGGVRAEQMDPADAAWLHMDRPTNLMVVNTVLWFDAPVDQASVLQVFAELLARGWTEADCAALAGGNVLRVLRAAESCSMATSGRTQPLPGRH